MRQLNAHALVNVRPGLGAAALLTRWVLALAVLLPRGLVPTLPAGRRRIDTSTTMRLLSTSSRALAPVAAVYAATAFAITVVAVTPLGVDTALAAAAACATGAGVWLHELGHAAALRRVPSCVVVRGLRVAVLHRPVGTGHTRAVAAAGPVVGVAAAAITAFIATTPEGATAAGVLGTQSLGFTVLTSDGRRLCGLR